MSFSAVAHLTAATKKRCVWSHSKYIVNPLSLVWILSGYLKQKKQKKNEVPIKLNTRPFQPGWPGKGGREHLSSPPESYQGHMPLCLHAERNHNLANTNDSNGSTSQMTAP